MIPHGADATAVAATPEATTPYVMTRFLRAGGVIKDASVVDLRFEPVGGGLMVDTVRFELAYSEKETGALLTIAAKFPARDPVALKSGADLGLYLTETRFYQELAPHLADRAPAAITQPSTKIRWRLTFFSKMSRLPAQ